MGEPEISLSDWIARDASVLWHGFTQMSAYGENEPIIVERGEGRELIDVSGRRYLDAISSLWVTTLGHHVPELDDAIRHQLDRVAHSTMLGNGNTAAIEFAEALAPRIPIDDPHIMYASDGAAAVEQGAKMAFQYWVNRARYGNDPRAGARTKFLTLGGAYHGDTIGSLSLGAGGFGTDIFDPLRFEVLRVPGYDDPDWSDAAIDAIKKHHESLAAIVVEPVVQGASGIQIADPTSVRRTVEAAQHHDVLVIVDEVATGFGRTGTLFASEQCGIMPDLMILGKGITGGYLPLSATVANRRVYDAFLGPDLGESTFYHGHSYGGNALACAVALRHLQLIDEWDVLANVEARSNEMGKLLDAQILPLAAVRDVRRHGLMCGVELAHQANGSAWGRRVSAAAVRRGVLLRPLGDVVVLMPMLTSTSPEIELIVDTLALAIEEVVGHDEPEVRR